MIINRRKFLQQSASLAALALVANRVNANETLKQFGCQLYSIRDVLPKDPRGYMKQLADMGYKYFESYSKDPLWGMSPKDAKSYLSDIGVKMVSTHLGLPETNEEMIAKCAEAGLNYVICPAIGMQPSADAWKQKAEAFNKHGETCKKYGMRYGYHNHSYSFQNANGVKGQRILLDNTDPSLVCFELDMCWIEAAGEDTIAHLKENGKRYELCHVKQLETKEPRPKQTDLANGIINYTQLLRAAKDAGIKYFLVEQEQYPVSPIESMKNDAAYLKTLNF
ncbi:sugar phosphate isomerase/epimerase family protein [Emticicia sp. 17c]|uniref:sugar phosphate isomerase/epimerase family protein n=1 Tax=Emticicia sp. 17c TaxID=3127704 RepID=UPI00301C93EC